MFLITSSNDNMFVLIEVKHYDIIRNLNKFLTISFFLFLILGIFRITQR